MELISAKASSGFDSYNVIVYSTVSRTILSGVGGKDRLTPRFNSASYVFGYRQTGMPEPVMYRFFGSLHCISCSGVPSLYCCSGEGCCMDSMVSDCAYAVGMCNLCRFS